jgi:thiosulfate dehydrogenase [quinone] large subunit
MVPTDSLSRRRFVHAASATGVAACAGCTASDGNLDVLAADQEVLLSEHAGLANVGESVLIDLGTLRPIAVTRIDAETFEVTGTECSHQHCGVARNGSGWRCPCHGAVFTLEGARTSGPAPHGLTVYDWMLDGDVLTILAP